VPAQAKACGYLLPMMPPDINLPRNAQGRFYHLNCGKGDLSPYIFTCGDPARAARLARRFEKVALKRRNREFLTYTGLYNNIPVSVIATGIGAAASAIAVVEAAQCVASATFIRLGSTGALQAEVNLGDLVITARALRDEDTTRHYAPPDFQPQAHPAVLAALMEAAVALQAPYHVGVTCTSSDFFAGQGRVVPGFPTLEPDKVARLSRTGVLNLEMEMSVYLTLAAVSSLKLRAGGACAVFAHRLQGTFAGARLRARAERRLLEVGLKAVEILAEMDKGKEGRG
jgi:uridine phosphorylase